MKRFVVSLAAVALSCQLAAAQRGDDRAADEAAIRKAVRSYVDAFQRGDARAVARHWSSQGVYVCPSGERFQGPAAIEKEYAAYFAGSSGRKIELGTPSIRFLAPNVAVEEGTARVSRRGEPLTETSYIAIHVKQRGGWKLDSVRETALPSAPAPPSHSERLKGLEWMIGHWVDKDENSTIDTVCQWTKNKNFITRSFSVAIKDRIELEGTQVIGWDPAAGNIRSWMFDSEGGFGEGVWTRKGQSWIIKTSRTLSGGEKASAINVITPVDRNSFTWQSTGREIDGELQPNIDEVTVVRKQPQNRKSANPVRR